jgi:tetratricopeptide (TPR) repeat protein
MNVRKHLPLSTFHLNRLAVSLATLAVCATVQAQHHPAMDKVAAHTTAKVLNDLYMQGKFADVGTQGDQWLRTQPTEADGTLRLKIANSLAWTNRLAQAVTQYEALLEDPERAQAARLPLANAYRWSGRSDLSMPLYKQALDNDKANQDILDGVEYAERDLRPRTTLQWVSSQDSSDLEIRTATLTHRWRDATQQQFYEVEGDLANNRQDPSGPNPRHTGATFRYGHAGLKYQPSVYVSVQKEPGSGLYGGIKLKLADWPIYIETARENFGLTSSSARALNAGLTANKLGIEAKWGGAAGTLSGRLGLYKISDGNQLRTTMLLFSPSWRPLGTAFKPYVSVDTRDVTFNTPNYWSPLVGSGTLGLGAIAEWAEKDWFFFASGQLGTRLYGEAGDSSWSASLGGQRWLNRDTAVTVNLWAMSSVRDLAKYKSQTLTVKLDRLW